MGQALRRCGRDICAPPEGHAGGVSVRMDNRTADVLRALAKRASPGRAARPWRDAKCDMAVLLFGGLGRLAPRVSATGPYSLSDRPVTETAGRFSVAIAKDSRLDASIPRCGPG